MQLPFVFSKSFIKVVIWSIVVEFLRYSTQNPNQHPSKYQTKRWTQSCSKEKKRNDSANDIEERKLLCFYIFISPLHYVRTFHSVMKRFSMQTKSSWFKKIKWIIATTAAKQSRNKLCFIAQKLSKNRKTAIRLACASGILHLLWLFAITTFNCTKIRN